MGWFWEPLSPDGHPNGDGEDSWQSVWRQGLRVGLARARFDHTPPAPIFGFSLDRNDVVFRPIREPGDVFGPVRAQRDDVVFPVSARARRTVWQG